MDGAGEDGADGDSGVGVAGVGAAVCSGSPPALVGAPLPGAGLASLPPPAVPQGVVDFPPSLPAPVPTPAPVVAGAPWLGVLVVPVLAGAPGSTSPVLEVPAPLPLAEPLGCAACSARSFSIPSAETMKSCQISAGNVPPSTGPPSNWVVIGTRLFG